MKKKTYIATKKGNHFMVKCKGAEGGMGVPAWNLMEYVLEVTALCKADGIEVVWKFEI